MKIRKPIIHLISILCFVLLAAAPQASYADFKLVVIGDTQNAQSQTAGLTSSIAGMSDVAFVAQMGDVVNACGESYLNQSSAYNNLDTAGIPYGVASGNHDASCAGFTQYFGASRYAGSLTPSYPSGYYQGSSDDRNHSFFFSAGGMDFIIIVLQYSPGTTQLNWANNLLQLYPDRRGIVVSHNILNTDNSWNNQTTYNSLSANKNLFLMLCGHMHTGSDGEANRTEPRTNMNPVHIIMTDYQDFGTNMLRPLTFSPASNQITVPHEQGSGSTLNLSYNMLYGDIDSIDCEVDGSDLATYIADYTNYTTHNRIDVATFSQSFGKNACQ